MARTEAQKRADKKYKNKRKGKERKMGWGYLYEDSAPNDGLQKFRESSFEGFACKHDRDISADGKPKETHWHVAIRFSRSLIREEAVPLLEQFGVKPASVQYRDNWRAVARYMIHMDDPNKAQYAPEDVVEVGGADWFCSAHRTSDKYRTIAEMQEWIKDNEIVSFAVFMDYCRDNNFEGFTALCDNCAVIIREYIKSYRYDMLDTRALTH